MKKIISGILLILITAILYECDLFRGEGSKGIKRGDSVADKSSILNVEQPNRAIDNGSGILDLTLSHDPASVLATLSYNLLSAQTINIDLTDMNGKLIKNLVNENRGAGSHKHILDLKGIEKGMYFIKTSTNSQKISLRSFSIQ